jgi:hypothetical protein
MNQSGDVARVYVEAGSILVEGGRTRPPPRRTRTIAFNEASGGDVVVVIDLRRPLRARR